MDSHQLIPINNSCDLDVARETRLRTSKEGDYVVTPTDSVLQAPSETRRNICNSCPLTNFDDVGYPGCNKALLIGRKPVILGKNSGIYKMENLPDGVAPEQADTISNRKAMAYLALCTQELGRITLPVTTSQAETNTKRLQPDTEFNTTDTPPQEGEYDFPWQDWINR